MKTAPFLMIPFLLLCLYPNPAAANDDSRALSRVTAHLANEVAAKDALKKQVDTAQASLQSSRRKLIDLSRNLQESEKTLSTLEDRIRTTKAKEDALTGRLHTDYGSIGNLILGLERMRRMPPETLILRPGAPLETAESAILLRSILPAINARAAGLSKDLKTLHDLRTSLAADREKAVAATTQLKTQQAHIQTLLDRREALYKKTKNAYDDQAEEVAKIAAKAQSLEQLVARIKDSPPEKLSARHLEHIKLPGGAWAVPVQGRTLIRFGQRDEIGAASEGIRIAGRSGALVTAPRDGIVRYAGPFRNYGNMVIIEHSNNLHSLLSGLSRMDVHVGQKISSGEPVGTLPASGADGPPTLYYELRHNGKPVDPSAKFPDLS